MKMFLMLFEHDNQIKRENVLFRNKVTPYAGMELRGVVHKTLLRGQIVFDRSAAHPLVGKPSGRLILWYQE